MYSTCLESDAIKSRINLMCNIWQAQTQTCTLWSLNHGSRKYYWMCRSWKLCFSALHRWTVCIMTFDWDKLYARLFSALTSHIYITSQFILPFFLFHSMNLLIHLDFLISWELQILIYQMLVISLTLSWIFLILEMIMKIWYTI